MIRRQVVVPAPPDAVWEFLTRPDQAESWLGGHLTWAPEEGGGLRFTGTDGDVRHGVVEVVRPARYLKYRWWPEEPGAGPASEVAYLLEPEEDHTRLTVQEAIVDGPGPDRAPSGGSRADVAGADPVVGRRGRRGAGGSAPERMGPPAASMGRGATASLRDTAPLRHRAAPTGTGSWAIGDDIRFRLWAREHQLTSVG